MFSVGLALLLLCLSIPLPLFAWEGRVISVIDGDLISVLHEGREERLRLFGVDTPDDPQDFGREAWDFTSQTVLGKMVEVTPIEQDRHGNILGIITVNGTTLNSELAKSGLAWVYGRKCTRAECREWKEFESEAKRRGGGLWSDPNPIPPWEYRRTFGQAAPVASGGRSESSEIVAKDKAIEYRGDIVKRIYHAPSCPEYNCRSCIADFKGKIAAEKAGYKPCPICSP